MTSSNKLGLHCALAADTPGFRVLGFRVSGNAQKHELSCASRYSVQGPAKLRVSIFCAGFVKVLVAIW